MNRLGRVGETKMAQNPNDSNVRDPGWPTFDHAFDRLTFVSFNNLEQQDRVDRTSPRRSRRDALLLPISIYQIYG